jgi:hypothetical protein
VGTIDIGTAMNSYVFYANLQDILMINAQTKNQDAQTAGFMVIQGKSALLIVMMHIRRTFLTLHAFIVEV